MTIDIRIRHILSYLRETEGAEQTILAGGAVRDSYLGIEPKDYDFFIPKNGFHKSLEVLKGMTESEPVFAKEKYGYADGLPIFSVCNFKYEGLDLQIMGSKYPNEEDFPQKVLNHFDFGINMIYYTGSSILEDTPEFHNDIDTMTMNLYNLTDLKYLPKYMDRYFRINRKLGNQYLFNCPQLKLVDKDGNEVKEESKKKDSPKAHVPSYLNIDDTWDTMNDEVEDVTTNTVATNNNNTMNSAFTPIIGF